MKKFTDFIIDKRYLILLLFICLAIFLGIESKNVKINYDMAKYLPDTSQTRIGMNIMDEEFADVEESTLNISFKGLDNEYRKVIKSEIEDIDGVKEVDYDEGEDYNQGDYALYIVKVKAKADSKMAKEVYNDILAKYQNYDIMTSGYIADSNRSVLPFWIIALAVGCALIILLIMCESYVEPFLFLATILLAVILNKGTNIFFNNVSHITDSIAAILQMALSMDYSIMLMNRYDQEKKQEKDKVKAMKIALRKAFQSISSSSVTTIVGLLALVFMSFKIGKDLGLILAKGVLFSLICIFFVLPALILMFDKSIEKTKKKSPHIKLNWLGNIAYKFRWLTLIGFLFIFGGSFLLKGNLGIDYTEKQSDEIATIFKENNQIAIIYDNDEEPKIAKYLDKIAEMENVEEVLGYGNTINELILADDLNQKLDDLGTESTIDDYLIKIIYYDYYTGNGDKKIVLNDFLQFIQDVAYKNEKLDDKIDSQVKSDIERLENFTSSNKINKKLKSEEVAKILEIDNSKASDLFVYYLAKNNKVQLNLENFISFINKDVLTNEKYKGNISEDNQSKLSMLEKLASLEKINKYMDEGEIASTLEIEENLVADLFKYYILKNDLTEAMSLEKFADFVLEDVLKDEDYAQNFTSEKIERIELLAKFSDKSFINQKMNSKKLSEVFGLGEEQVKQVLLLKFIDSENTSSYKFADLITNLQLIKSNTHYLDEVDITQLAQLKSSLDADTEYSVATLAEILKNYGIEQAQLVRMYNLVDYSLGKTDSWVLNPLEFVNLILDNSEISQDADILKNLQLLREIMSSSIKGTKYSYKSLAKLIGEDEDTIKEIYTLYVYNKGKITLTPPMFVDFILDNRDDEVLSEKIDSSQLTDLEVLSKVMDGVSKNVKYYSKDMSSLLNLNNDDVELLYGLYDSYYVDKNYKISLNNFISFILKQVITNDKYKDEFSSKMVTKLQTVKTIMSDSLNKKSYTAEEALNLLSKLSSKVDKNIINILYSYYGSVNDYNEEWTLSVETFVNYLYDTVLNEEKYADFIDQEMHKKITDAKEDVEDAKEQLVGKNYSRVVVNTKLAQEGDEVFNLVEKIKTSLENEVADYYVIGSSPMALEMSQSFNQELNLITIITMVVIFLVVAITFKSAIIPLVLVLIIQCAVYLTMGILSFTHENVYFISILIVQSILMGATIDYAILYTSYYLENRKMLGIREAIKEAYNKSINTILTSSLILIIVTLIIANFASAIAAKICKTISEGTICSTILILILLPGILACLDRLIVKSKKIKNNG